MQVPFKGNPSRGFAYTPPSRSRRHVLLIALVAIPLLTLSACSGGGGNSSSGAAGSNWDQMNWDQGHWG